MPARRGYRLLGGLSLAVFAAAVLAGFLYSLHSEGRVPPLQLVPGATVRDLLERDDYQAAARELEAMTRMNPQASHLRKLLGYVLSELGRHEEAVERYREALEVRPGDLELRVALIEELEGLGRFAESLPHLRELADRFPDDEALRRRLEAAQARAAAAP